MTFKNDIESAERCALIVSWIIASFSLGIITYAVVAI